MKTFSVTIQMKAPEQYFLVVLFIVVYWINPLGVTIQIRPL